MAESRRWYCTYCGQSFVSSDTDKCSLCRKTGGLVDPMDQAANGGIHSESFNPEATSLSTSPQWTCPQWLTAGRIWVIFKLGSAGLVMLGLAGTFAFAVDLQIAIYPFLGFLICLSALVVFFRRWRSEGKNSGNTNLANGPVGKIAETTNQEYGFEGQEGAPQKDAE